jgi:hypothetical protein
MRCGKAALVKGKISATHGKMMNPGLTHETKVTGQRCAA